MIRPQFVQPRQPLLNSTERSRADMVVQGLEIPIQTGGVLPFKPDVSETSAAEVSSSFLLGGPRLTSLNPLSCRTP